MKNSAAGFSLIELIVVMAIMAIVTTIAAPSFMQWRQNAVYREASLDLLGALRKARNFSISNNREYRVEVQLSNRRFRLSEGNLASNSSAFTPSSWYNFPTSITLRRNADCLGTADLTFGFNPNGTSNSGYICIMDNSSPPVRHSRVGIPSASTGRAVAD
ncbi:prepilin-type N-terminal cleavage/methylation domain-containing protein [Geothermobacter hydrogeniphilus]|uniref:prepilin-type N-terminal cleavage/methylation domain-containing protein n=1 Tax=Geothermobacter hydrogeniphilus TaxID=1969733 RepID=UPI001304BC80|nr:prepilin-type N-terminal cleavage/methylation domain-containing protein [Geothermobacter hydrogeniphilus]